MLSETRYEELLSYTYETACRLYGDDPELDVLVQDTLLALIMKEQAGERIEHVKGFLSSVLRNKHNDRLRSKYRDRIVTYDFPAALAAEEPEEDLSDEHEAVRREIGRLLAIYREVTVRHYMHGQTVEQIAKELSIPKGTVLSRLSAARRQIKGGLQSMKPYSTASYEPKNVRLGIWGNTGMTNEPFSLLSSKLEKNLLVLAYDKPVSVGELAAAMGMPCAYLEEAVDKLVAGELMGRTSGGLVYTRCFLQAYREKFGDVRAQEALAADKAKAVFDIVWKHAAPLMAHGPVTAMTEKQKATLLLHIMVDTLSNVITRGVPTIAAVIKKPVPERPNGGRWLAQGTVFEPNETPTAKYDASGPVQVYYHADADTPADCMMYDYQSLFGDAHFAYRRPLNSVLRLYASFFTDRVKPDSPMMYDMIPDLEALHILRRDENGKAHADIPALTFKDAMELLDPVKQAILDELSVLLTDDLMRIWEQFTHRVPAHVDEREQLLHAGALNAYVPAQLLAIVEAGLLPYPVTVGETPIILVLYRE